MYLPSPSVFNNDLFVKNITAVPNDELRIEEFQGVLKELPACNYALLSWIIVHLVHVLDHVSYILSESHLSLWNYGNHMENILNLWSQLHFD